MTRISGDRRAIFTPFAIFAGYHYWFPKAFGFTLDERLGKAVFWCWFIGFNLAFMPSYLLGFWGGTRRMQHISDPSWKPSPSAQPSPSRRNAMTKLIAAAAALLVCAHAARAAGDGSISGKVSAIPEKYLKDSVVYLKQVPGTWAPKTHTIDQKGMEFRPHILTVTVGDSVKFLNNDGVDHNVYTPDGEAYNLGLFAKGQSRDHQFVPRIGGL